MHYPTYTETLSRFIKNVSILINLVVVQAGVNQWFDAVWPLSN